MIFDRATGRVIGAGASGRMMKLARGKTHNEAVQD
jgi:hypothetical protein